MSIKKIIEMLLTILGIMILFWFVASYFDVILHNLDSEPQYKFWNIFKILVENKM